MAPVCQKCGHTGFQEVMIYCRQCRVACEHKYCLYKFPKKGEKVRWYCEDCRPTFPKKQEVGAETCKLYPESIQKLQNHNPDLKNNKLDAFCPSQHETVRKEAEIIKSSSSDLRESKKFKKQRTLTASNDRAIDQKAPCTQLNHLIPPSTSDNLTVQQEHRDASHQNSEVCRPEPVVDFVWRGCVSFGNEEFIPFRAHGSSLACQKVFDAAKNLPPILPMDRHLRRELQQSIFKNGPPTDDQIGLYLLPDVYAKQERVSGLVDDIITKDLMFMFIFNEIELLVFPSCILPEEYHKLNDQYYLWGAFRNKQLQGTVTSTNQASEQLAMKIQDKNANAITVTSTFEANPKSVFESKIKHTKDRADADAILFGSPIAEKLKCILARINEKHTQINDDDSPCVLKTVEHIRAIHREEETNASRLSRCAEIGRSKPVQNKKENTLNQQDRENSNYGTRSKTGGYELRKRERSRYEDQAYNNLTKRQKALYDSKIKEQNRVKTEMEKHMDESKKRMFREDDNCASNLYVEKRRRLDEETRMEKETSHGTSLSRSQTEQLKQETKKDDMGELKSTTVKGMGEESSVSPVSSVCNEEQKQRDANGLCDNTRGQG